MQKVIVKRIENYHLVELKQFIKLLLKELNIKFKEGDSILVKPNFLLAKSAKSPVITNPMVIRALLEVLIEKKTKPFIYEIPSVYSVKQAAKTSGVDKICEKLGVEIKKQDKFELVSLEENKILKKLYLPKEVKEADFIINLTKLKTHSLMGLTLGVKNMFGLVKAEYRNQFHLNTGRNREAFANLLVDIYNLINPDLTILDGIIGMEGNGPANGISKQLNLVAASKSAYALDAFIIDKLKLSPSSIPIQKVAIKRNMFGAKINDVKPIGDNMLLDSIKMPDTYLESSRKFFHSLLNKSYPLFKSLFDARPVINLDKCVSCFNCKKICPAKAINNHEGKPFIDYKKCVRCFCCHEVCPYNAIPIHKTFLRKFFEKRLKQRLSKKKK